MPVPSQQTGSQAPAPPAPPVPVMPARPGAATGAAPAASQAQQPGDAATNAQSVADRVREAVQREMEQAARDRAGEAIVVQPPPYREPAIPPEVITIVEVVFGSLIAIILGYPIIRLVTRVIEKRMDRSLVNGVEVERGFRQLQQSVDAMAIEIERIGEAQRFQAKLLAERAERVGLPGEGQARG